MNINDKDSRPTDALGLPVWDHRQTYEVISHTLQQMGLEPIGDEPSEWHREQGNHLIALTATGDGTWWLTVTGTKPEPAMEFAGNLGECLVQYVMVTTAITAGVFRGAEQTESGACWVCGTITTKRCINPGHRTHNWFCEAHESDTDGVCRKCSILGYKP